MRRYAAKTGGRSLASSVGGALPRKSVVTRCLMCPSLSSLSSSSTQFYLPYGVRLLCSASGFVANFPHRPIAVCFHELSPDTAVGGVIMEKWALFVLLWINSYLVLQVVFHFSLILLTALCLSSSFIFYTMGMEVPSASLVWGTSYCNLTFEISHSHLICLF